MSYVRVSILGQTLGGEVWSVNPVFDPTGEFGGTVDPAALSAAASAIAALTPTANMLKCISTSLSITGARVEVRDDTSDALIGTATSLRGTALVGTVPPVMPAQAAIVCSLRTTVPGGSGRGRLYWPAVGAGIGTDLRFNNPGSGLVRDGIKSYLAAMQAALVATFPLIGFDLAVRSKTTHTTPHVNQIRVGDVIDTQRRRRDHLAEAYSLIAYP